MSSSPWAVDSHRYRHGVNNSTYAQLDGVDFTIENAHNPAIALSLDDMAEF